MLSSAHPVPGDDEGIDKVAPEAVDQSWNPFAPGRDTCQDYWKLLPRSPPPPPADVKFSSPFALDMATLDQTMSNLLANMNFRPSATATTLAAAKATSNPVSPPTHHGHHHRRDNSTGNTGTKNVTLFKTEMCTSFTTYGFCRYGIKCKFAHGTTEIRTVSRHPKYKTQMCRSFFEGRPCPYGKRCCYLHHLHHHPDALPSLGQPQPSANDHQSYHHLPIILPSSDKELSSFRVPRVDLP